jgi:primosomal protein N'
LHHRAAPVELEVRKKIRNFDQRRAVAAHGKRELRAARALAETDLLLHAAIIRTGETGSGKTRVLTTRIAWLLKAGEKRVCLVRISRLPTKGDAEALAAQLRGKHGVEEPRVSG